MSLASGLLERLVASTRRTRRDVRSRPPPSSRPSSKRSDSPRRYALSRTVGGCDVSVAGRANGWVRSRSFSCRWRRGHRAWPWLARRRSPARRICPEGRSRPRRSHLPRHRHCDDAALMCAPRLKTGSAKWLRSRPLCRWGASPCPRLSERGAPHRQAFRQRGQSSR
jgi:hypothetical protein